MSNNAFHHKDVKISVGMRCALGIMHSHFGNEGMEADSLKCAAQKMTPLLYKPSKLGRSHNRRNTKMKAALEVAIGRGLLRYSETECRLTLTREGRKQLKMRRRTLRSKKPSYINSAVLANAA